MRYFAYSIILLLASSGLWAQTNILIKEVLIEENAEQDALKEQKEAGISKLVASSKELNNFGHHAAGDVLKRMPRILVQGPPSFNRNIMMAGLDKQFQSVLINGNRPAGGEDYRDLKLDRIPVDMIDKIEVIYNPPVIYGADATLGLVNIILKDTPEKQLFSIDASFDYSSTKRSINPECVMSYGNKWNRLSVFGSYSFNKFCRNNKVQLSDTSVTGNSNEEVDVSVNGFTGTLAFKPDTTQIWKWQSFLSHYYENAFFIADVKRRTKGGLSFAADTADDKKLRILHTHELSYKKLWKQSSWHTSLLFAEHYDSKDRWRLRENNNALEVSFEDEFQRNSEALISSNFCYNLKQKVLSHKINAGIKASLLNRSYERLVYTKLNQHLFWDDIADGSYSLNENKAGFYASDEIIMGNFFVMPAVRFDVDAWNYKTTQDEGTKSYWNINPSIHTKYKINSKLFIKADVARQISRPPFNLMVPVDKIKNKKQIIERGNPELVPSIAVNTGFGIEKYFNNNNYLTIRGFYAMLRQLIETREVGVDDNYGYRICQSVNVDSGKVWGLDVSMRFRIFEQTIHQLTLVGNVSFLGSEVRDPNTLKLRRLNEQSQCIANATCDYLNTILKLQCSIGVNYVGERYIFSTIDEGAKVDRIVYAPFAQVDAKIKYFYSNKGSIYINAINLFNNYNSIQQGVVSEQEFIGRNIIIGTSINF